MDIDFPLILVILTGLAFVVWLFDLVALRPARRRREHALKHKYPRWEQEGSKDQQAFVAEAKSTLALPLLVDYAHSFLPVLAIVLVLRSFLVEPFQIPSSSMVPTLLVGDYILVNKFAYGVRLPVLNNKVIDVGDPQRGDVMVFFPPNDKRYFIKRVIGVPGDRIMYRNKTLYINGKRAPQSMMAQRPPARASYQIV